MFLLQCWSYLHFLRFDPFACFPGFLWGNVYTVLFHIEDYLHGILFCKTKSPPKDKLNKTRSIRPSTTLFIRFSDYHSEQLDLTLHVWVLAIATCWFITYLISRREEFTSENCMCADVVLLNSRDFPHRRMEAGRAALMCAYVERHKHTTQLEDLLMFSFENTD